jgi:hypothetical protein
VQLFDHHKLKYMPEEKSSHLENDKGVKPERTFHVEDENIITGTGKNASGSESGSPAGGNYGKKEEPRKKGLPLDKSDKETKEMGNDPRAIDKMHEEEVGNDEAITKGNALSPENSGGDSTKSETRPSGL